jgi:uncharacterized Ntn-hydrolase superfamily protein
MTYSITAYDPAAAQLGVALQTHLPGAGAMVPWLRAGVGAIATQALVWVEFGPLGLRLLEEGATPQNALRTLLEGDSEADRRQLAVLGASGQVAVHTGKRCVPFAGHRLGSGYSVQANMMKRAGVPEAMAEAFEGTSGSLLERMMAALEAAEAMGGDIRGPQSACAMVAGTDDVTKGRSVICDLRVDLDSDPVRRLGELVDQHEAQRLDRTAHKLAATGDLHKATEMFGMARDRAPDASEMQFWQAVGLACKYGDLGRARQLFADLVAREPQWRDLLTRMAEAGWFERPEAIERMLQGR